MLIQYMIQCGIMFLSVLSIGCLCSSMLEDHLSVRTTFRDATLFPSHVVATSSSDDPPKTPMGSPHQTVVTTYQLAPLSIQTDIIRNLQQEWGTIYTHEYVVDHWNYMRGCNVMYVMYQKNDVSLTAIGTVAVDIRVDTPFLSSVYVCPEFRKQGYASLLLQIVEEHVKLCHYTYVRLWCTQSMILFYTKRGWISKGMAESMCLMHKTIY